MVNKLYPYAIHDQKNSERSRCNICRNMAAESVWVVGLFN